MTEFLHSKFKIKIDLITKYGYVAEKKLSTKLIGECGVNLKDPIYVKVCARKVSDDVIVQGEFSVNAVVACARCLREIEYIIKKDNYFRYFKKPYGENINLTESLREDIMVSLPIRVLCQKDCKGLCPHCGTDLNKGSCECSPQEEQSSESVFDILGDAFEK
ncbi:DUF177 domain-containing protein [bacterium]|nr:DUF177 domain-containing protein [bacterium]